MKPKSLVLLAIGAMATLLTACGGGGGGAGRQPPVVSAASVTPARYGDTLLLTLAGSELDQALTLTSPGCRDFVRSTTAPHISGATVAYYTCTVSGVGDLAVTVQGGGITAATVPFTVAQPQVSMLLSNGAGVSGTLVITLDPTRAPLTVDNFLAYVKSGFYNGTSFHRNARENDLSTFALQGGGYTAPVTAAAAFPTPKPTGAPVALEVGRGLSNLRYTVAMARTSVPNSATSEFFINTADNTYLDTSGGGYAVFGSVTTGTTVVDAMVAAPCTLSPINFNTIFVVSPDCVPEPNIVIAGATQTR
jgi:cyclophilin family peptidyl-prolyl cis-trans isomerase